MQCRQKITLHVKLMYSQTYTKKVKTFTLKIKPFVIFETNRSDVIFDIYLSWYFFGFCFTEVVSISTFCSCSELKNCLNSCQFVRFGWAAIHPALLQFSGFVPWLFNYKTDPNADSLVVFSLFFLFSFKIKACPVARNLSVLEMFLYEIPMSRIGTRILKQ